MDYNTAYLFYLTWGYWPAEYLPPVAYPFPFVGRWERRYPW